MAMIIAKNEALLKKIKSLIDQNAINMNVADMLMGAFSYTDLISDDEIKLFIKEGYSEKEAILQILYRFYGLDDSLKKNQEIMDEYFLNNIKKLNPNDYLNNPYTKTVKSTGRKGKYQLKYLDYEPFQLFAVDDIKINGHKEYSQIGYFDHKFSYLALTEGNNVWMSLNPNEIETMKPYITKGKGDILVLGLGMGYVPFMLAAKGDVKSVTIIEKDKEIISLFNSLIYPFFPHKEKIKIIDDDALKFLQKLEKKPSFDYIFADLWHDPEDGLPLFVSLKKINPNIDCWLEVSLYALLKRCMITLLEEQLDNYQEGAYQHAKNYTDKVINKYFFKTKNLRLENEEDLVRLLNSKNLLNLLKD